ncbi:MAG: aminoacyl-histidine dipeptidase, partial [Acidobacteria bacterium]
RKPASRGWENAASVCLQGHLDMVCEKHPANPHDFSKDPLELVRKDDVIMANGTTLGADNGIAVATCLAIMEDRSLEHGPLEFLFTVDEETGLTGAQSLQPGFLQSKTLLNLDSEEEGELYVGCAGGRDTRGTWDAGFEAVPAGMVPIQLTVGGLRGGHSGLEIDKGRGNALKIINRAVVQLLEMGGRLSKWIGGSKRNAIPRDSEAVVYVAKAKADAAVAAVEEFNRVARAELATVEPNLAVTAQVLKGVRGGKVVRKAIQKKLTQTIAGLPHGVIKMSADIPGLVETSTNVAVITTDKKTIDVQTSQRSSVASEIVEIADSVRAVFELGGAKVTGSDGYPGWKPNLDSPVLNLAKKTYMDMFGKESAVKAVHAGLECGIIGEKFPGMDMVSFGPTMADVHSPNERLYFETVPRFNDFLLGLLKNIAKG